MMSPPPDIEPQPRAEPPPRVQWWVPMIPLFIAIVGAIQAIGLVWVGASVQHTTRAVNAVNQSVAGVQERVQDTTKSINLMEAQINSNMERQIKQAISEALAKYRLGVLEDEMEDDKSLPPSPPDQ